MPRKPITRSNSNYYHVTARSNNREFFYLPIQNVWDIMSNKLAKLQIDHGIKIACFVLMNNHFHLLILTPHEDIDRIMYFFMKGVTLEIQKCSGRINKIFGGRYKGSMIDSYGYLMNVYKYIYRNPVEANISATVEQYPYSTLLYQNQESARIPFRVEKIMPPHVFLGFENLDEVKWLNQRFDKSESDSIKCGLQKTIFSYERDRASGRPIEPVVKFPKKKSQDELWADMFSEVNLELNLSAIDG